MGLGVASSSAHNLRRVLIVLIAESEARYRENPPSAAGPSTGVCGSALTALHKMIQNSLFHRLFLRDVVSNEKKGSNWGAPRFSARRLSLLIFYLPVIILEAWMLSARL